MADNRPWPDTRDKFLIWFWKGSNGNNLVKELNATPSRDSGKPPDPPDYIRREKYRPTIYAIVLNDNKFPCKSSDGTQWKLCKVGFTHVDTTPGHASNRMETVQQEIIKKYNENRRKSGQDAKKATASVLFVLPIGAVDTTRYLDTEKRIREKVGTPVPKETAKKHCLPCSTEWVLTTQKFIGMLKKQIDAAKKDKKRFTDVIDIFKESNSLPPPTGEAENWLKSGQDADESQVKPAKPKPKTKAL